MVLVRNDVGMFNVRLNRGSGRKDHFGQFNLSNVLEMVRTSSHVGNIVPFAFRVRLADAFNSSGLETDQKEDTEEMSYAIGFWIGVCVTLIIIWWGDHLNCCGK